MSAGASASSTPGPSAPAPPAPTPPAGASAGALMRWNVDIINSHQVAPRRALWTAETLARFPHRTLRGADAVAEYFEALHAAIPDLTMTIQSLVEDGEQVMMRWRMTGTHTGAPYEGIAPSGARIDIDGIDDAVFSAGRMVSNFVVFDQMQLARQLGLAPADGSRLDVGLKWAFNRLRARPRR